MKKIYFSLLTVILLCFCSTNVKAVVYYYVGAGASITSLTSWATNSVSGTGNPANFAGTNSWNFNTATSLTLSTTWTVAPAASINFGDGTNALMFVMAGAVGTNSTNPSLHPFLNIKSNCTFVLQTGQQFGTNRITNATGSTFRYDAVSTVVVPTTYYNLMINDNLALNGQTIVNGTLTINTGKTLAMNGSQLTLNGGLAGTGEIIGDNGGLQILTIAGSGNVGTLYLQAGSRFLTGLALNSGTLTLNSDLAIDGSNASTGLTMGSGALNLNGHNLSFENATSVDFGSGTIIGSALSSLLFDNVGSISNSLVMDATSNTLKVLYLNSAGNTLTLGNSLNITDSISASNGIIATGSNLTLIATSALKARVGIMGTGGSISGPATVQTFAPGGTTGWAELGINGVTGQTISNWDGQFPMTCTGCTYDPSSLGGFYSIQGYNEADPSAVFYDTSVTSATPLTPGQGFWVYLGTGSGGTGDITYSNTGSLVQGQVNVNITNSSITGDANIDGFNLVANPYASPISLDKLFDFNTQGLNDWGENGIHLWNTDLNGGAGDDQTPQAGSGFIIPAGQGFYVKSGSPSATIVFDESMKTADNTSANPLQKTSAQTSVVGFNLKVTGSNGDVDNTSFKFKSGASTAFDSHFDMYKLFTSPGYMGTGPVYSQYTSISSKLNRDIYSINTLPVLTNSLTIPIVVRVSATGVYSISLSDVHNFQGCTVLKDKVTGLYHDLNTGAYACTINDTTYAARFELVLCEMVSTVTSIKQLSANSGAIQVMQDEEGPFVTTVFPQSTKATISVYNIIGQQIINDVVVEGTETKTRLNVNSHNEVLLIKVTTNNETVTKKIITH